MIRIAIAYASFHHGNTEKLVKGIAERLEVTLINAAHQTCTDLSQYDLIGFASGIDFGKFYSCVEEFLKVNLPEKKKVFFLYTCARTGSRFTNSIRKEALKKDSALLGEFGCKGYNTYGPWKLIGGMNKAHPTDEDIENAVMFLKSLV